jgi:hypothetical protein
MKIVLCCGDREWDDEDKIFRVLKKEHKKHPIAYVIEGGALGADYLSRVVAQKLGIQVIECPANWDFYKKAAGPIRNQKQLELLCMLTNLGTLGMDEDIKVKVLAFHSNIKQSKGTKDMVNRAKKAKVKVKVIK